MQDSYLTRESESESEVLDVVMLICAAREEGDEGMGMVCVGLFSILSLL